VITSAAFGATNIIGLVYVAAFAPDEGETLGDLFQKFPPAPGFKYNCALARASTLHRPRAHGPRASPGTSLPQKGAVLAATHGQSRRRFSARKWGHRLGSSTSPLVPGFLKRSDDSARRGAVDGKTCRRDYDFRTVESCIPPGAPARESPSSFCERALVRDHSR